MSLKLFTETQCTIGSGFCYESWPLVNYKQPWILMPKQILTEGVMSLIVSLAAAASLACFFLSLRQLWKQNIREIFMTRAHDLERSQWLTLPVGLSFGAVFQTFLGGVLMSFQKHLNFPSFFQSIAFPLFIWATISAVSSVTQFSIHGVIAMSTAVEYALSVDLASITDQNFPSLYHSNLYGTGAGRTELPNPGNPALAAGAITGNLIETNRAFTIDGMICSGQYYNATSYRIQCLVDSTSCTPLTFRFNQTNLTGPNLVNRPASAGNMSAPIPDILSPFIEFEAMSSTYIPAGVFDGASQKNYDSYLVSGIDTIVHMDYATNLPGLSLQAFNVTVNSNDANTVNASAPPPNIDFAKTYTYPYRMTTSSAAGSSITRDVWRAQCRLSTSLCDVTLMGGKVVSVSNCQERPLHCNSWLNKPFTNVCQRAAGIGELFRLTYLDAALVTLYQNLTTSGAPTGPDANTLFTRAVGLLSLAWAGSSLYWDDQGDGSFAFPANVLENTTVTVQTPVDAIAVDAFLLILSAVILFLMMTAFVIIHAIVLLGHVDWIRARYTWDPVGRYESLSLPRRRKRESKEGWRKSGATSIDGGERMYEDSDVGSSVVGTGSASG
ncbi:hypothetical protein HK101_000912, partial [Irineochytrium annulatum]